MVGTLTHQTGGGTSFFTIALVAIVALAAPLYTIRCGTASAAEPNWSYYDDVAPIDTNEIDAIRERTHEARKRLRPPGQTEEGPAEEVERPKPLPGPGGDERDDVPNVDLSEVDELRRQFRLLAEQRREAEQADRAAQAGAGAVPQPQFKEAGEPQESKDSKEPKTPAPKEPTAPDEPTESGAPKSPPPVARPKGPTQEERLKALSDRVDSIEKVLVGSEAHPGLAGLIGGYTRHNGFFLMSDNGAFFLRVPVLIQVDLRQFPGGQNGTNPGVTPGTFILQRARPMVHFRLWRYFRGFMTPDFGNGFTGNPNVQGRVQTPDAFGEWDYYSAFRIRVGKFKSPIGLEVLQGIQNLGLMERSLTRNLLPNRDLGAMIWGMIEHGVIEYQLGVFNGVPNANFYSESAATSSGKTLEARIFTRPFLNSTIDWLHGLGAGVGMSYGSVRNNNGQDPMQTETFSYTFFQYLPQVQGLGDRTRVSPQVAWYGGRFGLMGQYVLSSQRLGFQQGGPSFTTTHDAWSGQLSFLLTDDSATFGHVNPRHPLDPSKGNWGAFEIAVRFAQLNIDPKTFVYGLADPTVNVLRAKSTTLGVNWYLNGNIRLVANFVHTDFTGATPLYHAASHEDGLMFRTQLMF